MGSNDKKRFISTAQNPRFAAEMARRFEAGEIPPFGIVFAESTCDYLLDAEKSEAHIIQISFLITNRLGEVFLMRRATNADRPGIGHSMSTGESVLLSWSPVDGDPRRHPEDDAGLLRLYREEVEDPTPAPGEGPRPPAFHFLGLVRSEVRGPRYYFYVYEARYDQDSPVIGRTKGNDPRQRLRKDRADDLVAFVPCDDGLRQKLEDMQADLAALALWRHQPLGAWVADPHVRVVARRRDESPPHLESIPDAFISHSSIDDAVTNAITEAMLRRGLRPWIDRDTLKAGQGWYREITQAVRYARCFVLVCSRASHGSHGVRDEVDMAAQARRQWGEAYPIFPVAIEGVRREEHLPEDFRGNERGIHVMDLRDPAARDRKIEQLVDAIVELTKKRGQNAD